MQYSTNVTMKIGHNLSTLAIETSRLSHLLLNILSVTGEMDFTSGSREVICAGAELLHALELQELNRNLCDATDHLDSCRESIKCVGSRIVCSGMEITMVLKIIEYIIHFFMIDSHGGQQRGFFPCRARCIKLHGVYGTCEFMCVKRTNADMQYFTLCEAIDHKGHSKLILWIDYNDHSITFTNVNIQGSSYLEREDETQVLFFKYINSKRGSDVSYQSYELAVPLWDYKYWLPQFMRGSCKSQAYHVSHAYLSSLVFFFWRDHLNQNFVSCSAQDCLVLRSIAS